MVAAQCAERDKTAAELQAEAQLATATSDHEAARLRATALQEAKAAEVERTKFLRREQMVQREAAVKGKDGAETLAARRRAIMVRRREWID